MPAISVGSVEVDVIPNAQGIRARMQAAVVPAADEVGEEVGRVIGRHISTQVAQAIRDGVTTGGRTAQAPAARQGEGTGGAFARSLRAKLQEAFRSMPKLDVRLGDTGVDADLARLRARLESLSGKTIGIDIDAETARAQAADIEERLRRIGAAHPNVAVRADTARAVAQLQALQAEIDEVSRDPAHIRVETDGQLGTRLRAAVQQAEASLPNVNIGADTTPAQVEIARLRAQLSQLRDARIGIDIDAATAVSQIEAIQARLARLSTQDADVAVRVDAGSAAAQLAAFQAQVNRLDGQTARVDVDTSSGVSGMQTLTAAAIGFGPAIIPALSVVAAGLGSIAAAATAAGAGLGAVALVAVPAFKQISTALQAQKSAQDAATASTVRGSQAGAQAARQGLQQASAQQALATARRNAARQIADAERGVTDAVRQAAQANARAAEQVKSARQAVADAYQQAADRMQQANQQVVSAERDLTQAQKSARQAQLDLVSARKEAAEQLEDLNTRLTNSQLSQRDAEIALKEATLERDKVLKDAKSTDLDKERALLQYDQAVQRLKEQQTETKRLTSETKAANRAGVEGSDTVKAAQERVAQSQQDVVDKSAAVRKAQQDVAKTQIENTRSIAEAQSKLATAQKNVTEVQRQGAESIARAQERVVQAQQSGADSIASAQRQIASASLSAAGGVDQAATAQAKYQAELAKLTPSARETFNAYTRLSAAFSGWSESLQPQVMPIFTRALDGIRRALPELTPFVTEAADAIGDLQDRVGRGFESPWWQTFKKDLQGSVRPAITGLGVAFGNIFKGMTGVIGAFLPHMDDISGSMQSVTKKFADWGQSLKGSEGFERFLSYSSEAGPRLADTLGKIAGAFLSIGQALSPVSGPLLFLLGGLAEAIGIIAAHAPWMVQGIWLAIVAMRVWTIAQWALNAAMQANPITLIIAALVALVAIGIWAFNKFPWFRDLVLAAWEGIKTASLWLWNTVLKPFFNWFGKIVVWLWSNIIKPYIGFLIAYWRTVADVAMWLWRNVLGPVFRGIGTLITWWYNNIVKRYFALVKWNFQVIAAVAKWLYDKSVRPVFNAIGVIISWWWTNVVKRYFGYVQTALRVLGAVFKWLYDKGVKPPWNAVSALIGSVWRNGIRPSFDALRAALRRVADAFGVSKDAIAKHWDKIRDATKRPINFVLGTVWNKGIVGSWKKIGDWIPGLPKLKTLPLLAQGGTVPAQPGVFDKPTAIVGEGNPRHPEFVIPTDPKYRSRALGLWQAAGGQLMADGGILGDIVSGAKAIGSKIGGAISSAASFLKDPGKALDSLMGKLLSPLQGIKNSGWGKLTLGLPKALLKGLKDLVLGGGEGGAIGGTIPKGRRLTIINQALSAARVPPPGTLAQWQAGLNTLITRESGWNPNAVNRWDINAKNGVPSQGLAQTIPPTWSAYVPASLRSRGILDPVGNVAAAVRYIVARYGNITKVQQANANRPPAGYDSGGYLQPGLNLAYNGTGRPEPVFTTAQANALTSLAARGSSGGLGDLSVTVYVGNREITDIARAEVRTAQGELIQVLNAS